MGKHPGGNLVLEQSMGIVDATPLFESYHCLLNRNKIDLMMKQYEVANDKTDICNAIAGGTKLGISWDTKGFYSTLGERVRKHFHGEGPAVKRNIKAGWPCLLEVGLEGIVWG